MSFKFDFDIPDEDLENLGSIKPTRDTSSQGSLTPPASEHNQLAGNDLEKHVSQLGISSPPDIKIHPSDSTTYEIPLSELLESLPPLLSYSPLRVPLASTSSASSVQILRRDLFDARFQLANQEDDSDDEGSAFGNMIPRSETPPTGFQIHEHLKDNSPSDLIKGVYEGGLKTWEASLDLVSSLDQQGYHPDGSGLSIRGKRVLEAGCGTAVPTLYLLETLFRQLLAEEAAGTSSDNKGKTVVHLQDYNAEVLVYITFCNILLAFWHAKKDSQVTSASAESDVSLPDATKRSKEDLAVSAGVQYTAELDEEPDVDEIELTDEFIESFEHFLQRHDIELRFFAGSWQTFDVDERYNLVLTSETVYEVDNLPHLVKLLHAASTPSPSPGTGDLTLVACKRVYFGVGGGEVAFKLAVQETDGSVENVWNGGKGVERTVLQAQWES